MRFFGSGDRDIIGEWDTWIVTVTQDVRGIVHGAMRDARSREGVPVKGTGTFTCKLQQHWNWFICRSGQMRISWEPHEYQTFEFDVKGAGSSIGGIAEVWAPASAPSRVEETRYLRFEMTRRRSTARTSSGR